MAKTMAETFDLSSLFLQAAETLSANQRDVDALDGYNGNHGANMVENLRIMAEAATRRKGERPAQTLRRTSRVMQTQGHGGTSQYYARGLAEAAGQLEDQPDLDARGVTSLLQSILSSIPAEGHPQEPQTSGSVLEQLAGLATGAQPAAQAPAADPMSGLLGQLLGLAGGQPERPEQPSQPVQGTEQGGDVSDLLSALLPAGLAFLQAKQAGADTQGALTQALLSALVMRQADPLKAPTARSAAAGLLARSFMQALAK